MLSHDTVLQPYLKHIKAVILCMCFIMICSRVLLKHFRRGPHFESLPLKHFLSEYDSVRGLLFAKSLIGSSCSSLNETQFQSFVPLRLRSCQILGAAAGETRCQMVASSSHFCGLCDGLRNLKKTRTGHVLSHPILPPKGSANQQLDVTSSCSHVRH